jgi:hypothetical protein
MPFLFIINSFYAMIKVFFPGFLIQAKKFMNRLIYILLPTMIKNRTEQLI